MRVIYPFTDKRTVASSEALFDFCPTAERFDVSGSDTAYAELLAALWADQETFLVVEHDIVIHEGLVAEYEACDEEWCSSPYTYFDIPVMVGGGGLGCTKFSRSLMRRWPTAVTQAMEIPYAGHPPYHWCGCDYRIWTLLRRGGSFASEYPAKRHQSHTEVRHRSGKASHGCRETL